MRLVLLTGLAACVLAALAASDERKGAVPPVQPKPYRIGIAPSHITASPDPLFEPDADWRAVRDKIDFYKYYSLQLSPPKWASRLAAGPFVAFTTQHGIAIASEFGGFGLGGKKGIPDAAELAIRVHKPIFDAGGKLASMHLDGPVCRMLKGRHKHPNALTLEQIAARLADFWVCVHKAYPDTEIGLITNFPNWDYRDDMPGYIGHNTDESGVTYHEAVTAVHEAVSGAGDRIAFVEVDCPFNYYRQRRTRNGDAAVDNKAKFLALQKWCRQRKIKFHVIVNCEVGHPKGAELDAAQHAAADKAFHDGTLEYIRRLRADGIFPDVFLIQSWYIAPAEHLPESRQHTVTNTAREAIALIEKLYPRKGD